MFVALALCVPGLLAFGICLPSQRLPARAFSRGEKMQALLGPTLRSKSRGGSVPTAAALRDARFVLVYCSASWCGPCRAFTPTLARFFSAAAARLHAAVVLISCDRDEAAFASYWKSMPWDYALSPEDDAGQALMQRFGVRGIPSLLVFSAAAGTLVTAAGVEGLSRDPAGAAFPWVGAAGVDIGRRVALRGLVSRPELNGRRGVVDNVGAAAGRLQVALDAPHAEVLAVKRDNLDFAESGGR